MKVLYSITLLFLFSLGAFFVLAAPQGAQITNLSSERGTGSTATTSYGVQGNLTGVNLTAQQITQRWAGFFGKISANVQLADSANNLFFLWSVTNVTNLVIYAANGSVSDFTQVTTGNQSTSPPYLSTDVSDNFNRTFSQSAAFVTPTVSVASAPYTTTWQAGSQGSLRTYALAVPSSGVNIWAGVAIHNTSSFRPGQPTDFQILAPADANGVTYTFYFELP